MDCIGDEVRKRQKGEGDQDRSVRENITLGSLNLAQYEDIRKRSEIIFAAQKRAGEGKRC